LKPIAISPASPAGTGTLCVVCGSFPSIILIDRPFRGHRHNSRELTDTRVSMSSSFGKLLPYSKRVQSTAMKSNGVAKSRCRVTQIRPAPDWARALSWLMPRLLLVLAAIVQDLEPADHDHRHPVPDAVLVVPGAVLQAALDEDQAPLADVLGQELCGLAEGS